MTRPRFCSVFGLLGLLAIACGSDGGGAASTGGVSGVSGASTGGSAGNVGTGTGGTTTIFPTPEGTLFTDDFESGIAQWDVTQGTCSIQAAAGGAGGVGGAAGTNVLNCINGGNEARALAGDVWGEYSVQAKVKVNAMDLDRRIYLAGRFTDSNNWYGAAILNSTPIKVQLRKKVAGASADIAEGTYPIVFGTWYTLKLELKGSTLRLFVNDVLQIETTDTQFASGGIALLVDRSDVSWDDVIVTNP